MPLEDLIVSERPSVFSDEDRIMHTTKMVTRTFGVEVDQLGEVVMRDGVAVLQFEHGGEQHWASWRRQPSGAILWYLDGTDDGLILGGGERALQRLYNAIR